jgi:hypothetical protein
MSSFVGMIMIHSSLDQPLDSSGSHPDEYEIRRPMNMHKGKMLLIGRITRLMLICLVALLAAIPARPVFAGTSVDPSTLNPPVPPEFNPVCMAVGNGTICTTSFTQVEDPGGNGMICGSGANSFEVVSADVRTVQGQRYYDQNKNLTQRHFREVYVGTFTNPLTGAYLNFTQADTVIHNLAIPGDTGTGTEKITGNTTVHLPNGGTILITAGTGVFNVEDGTALFEAGPNPIEAYYAYGDLSAIQPICDALTK